MPSLRSRHPSQRDNIPDTIDTTPVFAWFVHGLAHKSSPAFRLCEDTKWDKNFWEAWLLNRSSPCRITSMCPKALSRQFQACLFLTLLVFRSVHFNLHSLGRPVFARPLFHVLLVPFGHTSEFDQSHSEEGQTHLISSRLTGYGLP